MDQDQFKNITSTLRKNAENEKGGQRGLVKENSVQKKAALMLKAAFFFYVAFQIHHFIAVRAAPTLCCHVYCRHGQALLPVTAVRTPKTKVVVFEVQVHVSWCDSLQMN